MARLPAHLEASGLIRRTSAAGGFATVLHKGEPDAGTILVVARSSADPPRLFERMPNRQGVRLWTVTRTAQPGEEREFDAYLQRRTEQDPDAWVIELDIADVERLIGFAPGDD